MFRVSWIKQRLVCLTHLCVSGAQNSSWHLQDLWEWQLWISQAPPDLSLPPNFFCPRVHFSVSCLHKRCPSFSSRRHAHLFVFILPVGPLRGTYAIMSTQAGACEESDYQLHFHGPPWWDVGFTRFHARTSFIFLFGGSVPLSPSSYPKCSPFGVKLSRWSQSRAFQGTA